MKASIFKVLGHTKRLEIVTLLRGHSLTVSQIVQMTGIRQSAVSQHLISLKKSHFVQTQKLGKEIYYSLNTQIFQDLAIFIKTLSHQRPAPYTEPTVIDPICHMALTPSSASYTAEYGGVRHYFCGKGCMQEFHATH